MKSRRAIFILFLLLALGGGLAWEFWPVENSTASVNPPAAKPAAPKIAVAPKPTPVHIAAVEAPKIAPATPRDAPVPEQPANSFQSIPPGTVFNNPSPLDPTDITDLGEVFFTSGVPQQLSLNDGTPVTVTATLGNNNDVSLRVEITQTSANGGTSHMTMITGTQQGRTMTLGGPRGMSRIKITPRVN